MKSWMMLAPSYRPDFYDSAISYAGMFRNLGRFGFSNDFRILSMRSSEYATLESVIVGSPICTGMLLLVKR